MDECCNSCPRLCKRLDCDDKPLRYDFVKLTAIAATALMESIVREYRFLQLDIENPQQDRSNRSLTMFFKAKHGPAHGTRLCVVSQAKEELSGTSLSFEYHVPKVCCENLPAVTELSDFIAHFLDVLFFTDWLLKTRVLKSP